VVPPPAIIANPFKLSNSEPALELADAAVRKIIEQVETRNRDKEINRQIPQVVKNDYLSKALKICDRKERIEAHISNESDQEPTCMTDNCMQELVKLNLRYREASPVSVN